MSSNEAFGVTATTDDARKVTDEDFTQLRDQLQEQKRIRELTARAEYEAEQARASQVVQEDSRGWARKVSAFHNELRHCGVEEATASDLAAIYLAAQLSVLFGYAPQVVLPGKSR